MDPEAETILAATVASASLDRASANFASGSDPEISRVTGASSADEEGRFLPGTLLGGRYRILTLLGRGGMGEVYRAMDLTLGQSVALKFLPEEACHNQRLLERFHGEVRVARLVSHPNVCRVFDIGSIEGIPFISMEYVDGEDLACLLTRIGRLPADKAVETARKLCAGLAAAHDRGIIHRDLKPQNIMINKRGEVVIMDFGLAAIANELSGAEARNGTPAYMSPEQLKGAGVTARSDLYALGLVLYELFTGKRAFDAQSVQKLLDQQEAVELTSMTSVAVDIDPAVEKIIRRCLDPDPNKRPVSALNVMAALPGGDPLAAALAAGETPSPAMVAAAGKLEGMPRRYSVPCLAAVVLCLLLTIPIRQVRTAMVHGGLDQAPDVLAHQGREIAAAFGHTAKPADSAVLLRHRSSIFRFLGQLPKPQLWDEWLAWEPALEAVYRESPRPLIAEPAGEVDATHPPPLVPGMSSTTLDANGRLLSFSAVPQATAAEPPQPIGPEGVFQAAHLDMAAYTEVTPLRLPAVPFDRWRAWKGPHPHFPNASLQVEIAWWKGRVTWARILYPAEQQPAAPAPVPVNHLRDLAVPFLIAMASFFVVLLARRNWTLARADRAGAFRIALASLLLQAVSWAGSFHPVADLAIVDLFVAAVGEWLLGATVLWFAYLAIEPEVRARWPHSVVTWNRVLAGRWLDAQVGSHVLIGAAVGSSLWIFFKGVTIVIFRNNRPTNWDVSLRYLMGGRHWIGAHAGSAMGALSLGLFVFLTIFGMRQLLRNEWLASAAAAMVFTLLQDEVSGPEWWLIGLLYGLAIAALIFVLLRLGLVATIAAVFYVRGFDGMALGADWRAWYVPASVATLLLLVGIAIFAFWRSLGGRELLEGDTA